MDIPLSKKEVRLAILETVKNNMETDVHIRLIVSRGIKTPYQNPKVTISPPTIVIIPEYKKASEDVKNGITVGTVKTIRDDRTRTQRLIL